MSERRSGRGAHVAGLALVLAASAVALSACDGSTSRGRHRIAAGRLVVYSSLPLIGPTGADGRAVLEGERMALAAVHGRIGRYRIVLRSLDDATASSRGWNPGRTDTNATLAARDGRTIGYLGDLNSGASAVSLPVLNRARIPQISPLSTAVGLTQGGPEAQPGEPEKYYPASTRTFARIVPSDAVQANVQVALQRQAGCQRIFVLFGDDFDGRDAADSYQAAARRAGLNVIGADQFPPSARSYQPIAARVARLDPDCVLVSALVQDHAAAVTDAVARAVPAASVFVTSAPGEPAFVARRHGVETGDDPQLTITDPTLSAMDYPPAGRRFLRRFNRLHGSGAMQGIWGDAAMSLMLDAVARASDDGRRAITRTRVLRAIFATRDRRSVLGTYSITATGDTSLRRYGVYRVRDGRLAFWKAVRG